MSFRDDYGTKITELVLSEYEKLSAKGRPVTRSNGAKEGTIVAAVIASDTRTDKHSILTITTGVKSTPNDELARSKGKILHDCHAEILALRGFNRLLLEHIKRSMEGIESNLIHNTPNGFEWNNELELTLFISKLPCGELSMSLLEEMKCEDENSMTFEEDDNQQYITPEIKTILRGRCNFNKRNYVRTKPGRIDSKATYSKSCSDKLYIRHKTSVLNSLTSYMMPTPLYISNYVIPNINSHQIEEMKLYFDRPMDLHSSVRRLYIHTSHYKFGDDLSPETTPSSMSALKILFNDNDIQEEQILNGVKNGYYTKASKPLRKNCESKVSRYSLWSLFITMHREFKDLTYLEFKRRYCAERAELIRSIKSSLSSDGWLSTAEDDCQLP
ncbi:tRNA-specific adenosine deaminase 1 [Nakaseomyces glabratus]|nr:Adenosine-deaminase (editase) domain [Nakaseomyces glabratus]KTB15980.1 tRNA-specific adenosine deaminase 1 [Nakaseomyces glabratus]KTB25316.1 tRNA-specific adenosine deaminase 1 [Nakaseomyces glabratus]QNG14479.1 uncharacterized protein GWK60_H07711 [Nakaseomyces glabratus]